jgi:hypothetical protein
MVTAYLPPTRWGRRGGEACSRRGRVLRRLEGAGPPCVAAYASDASAAEVL